MYKYRNKIRYLDKYYGDKDLQGRVIWEFYSEGNRGYWDIYI